MMIMSRVYDLLKEKGYQVQGSLKADEETGLTNTLVLKVWCKEVPDSKSAI
jgi:hypothetical protein